VSFDALLDRKPWDHAIELELGAKASSTKVYPLSPNEQTELDAFIEENLASGRIRPSKSQWQASGILHQEEGWKSPTGPGLPGVERKDGKECISLPLISDLINRLRGARYFTKLDVRWGYNNVRIKEGDEWKGRFPHKPRTFRTLGHVLLVSPTVQPLSRP